ADLPTSRQIRTWTRFLHTGQAVGWIGQLIAGLACLGGCVLAYTGFALAWRRFFGQKKSPAN
ncbi:MAG: PepSY-associated TM helix domain-containing protein, partial [Lacunisphaera sp.]